MKVSVVIPTFHRPDLLKRSIESVLNQTYKNLEIIIVDDNGINTDFQKESACTVNSFTDNRIKYIAHTKNKGGSAARNTGWKASSGKYITFLDDDDEISCYKLEKQVACLEAHDNTYGACYTAYHKIIDKNRIIKGTESIEGDVYAKALARTLYVGSGSNLLLKKEAVDTVGGYDETFQRNQDLEFNARVAEKYKFAYVPENLLTIHYEDKSNNHTATDIDAISRFYLSKFEKKINDLPINTRKNVLITISLERARFLFFNNQKSKAFNILRTNNVPISSCIKYCCYLFKRMIYRTSYGFYLN